MVAFAYPESEYGFHRYMKQVHGAYYYIAWSNLRGPTKRKKSRCCMTIELTKKVKVLCGYGFTMPIRLEQHMTMWMNIGITMSAFEKQASFKKACLFT